MSQTPTASVLVMQSGSSREERDRLLTSLARLHPHASMAATDRWAAAAVGEVADARELAQLPSVERIVSVTSPFRLASREVFGGLPQPVFVAKGDGMSIGDGEPFILMAEYSAFEDLADLRSAARAVAAAGGMLLHLGEVEDQGESPARLAGAAAVVRDAGLAVSVEVAAAGQIERASRLADAVQVGSRNMQDFSLLRELGRTELPVLLRRGFGATVEEFLLAAEYVLSHGNGRVVLCESGIRTFGSGGAPRFEINSIPVIKRATHLPLVADPCQATEHSGVVPAVSRAALVAGADGLILKLRGPGDPPGSGIHHSGLAGLIEELRGVAAAVGRPVCGR